MSRLAELEAFIRIVETGSFGKTANALGISRSYTSKLINQLEARLGVQLLARTTRSVALTDTGRSFYNSCAPLVDGLSEAEAKVMEERAVPRGLLKITAPMAFGLKYVTPIISPFMVTYPEIRVHIDYSDHFIDLFEGGYDLAIRGGQLPDSSLRSRRLAPLEFGVAASPSYLKAHGIPKSPKELIQHDCLAYAQQRVHTGWKFAHPSGETTTVNIQGPLVSNNADALALAAIHGRGIVYQPLFSMAEPLADGRLLLILKPWQPPQVSALWAVYSHTTHIPLRARLFVQALSDSLKPLPWASAMA